MTEKRKTRLAFVGNSYIYFNDMCRLMEALGGEDEPMETDCCLRGGASFPSLSQRGGDMSKKFRARCSHGVPNAQRPDGSYDTGSETIQDLFSSPWDFVIMNDYSQAPCRPDERSESLESLRVSYAPLIAGSGATVVLMETPSYRAHTKNSEELGSLDDFRRGISAGYNEYCRSLELLVGPGKKPRVAPVNDAFAQVQNERPALWRDLYHSDDYHPSALGTYLMALVVFVTTFGRLPPLALCVPEEGATALFRRARRMLPPNVEPGRLPTNEEMVYLRQVAAAACGLSAPAHAKTKAVGTETGAIFQSWALASWTRGWSWATVLSSVTLATSLLVVLGLSGIVLGRGRKQHR